MIVRGSATAQGRRVSGVSGSSFTVARKTWHRQPADQLTAVDRSRLGPSACTLTWEELVEVDKAIQVVLGLTR
jgi:hypothetical protein